MLEIFYRLILAHLLADFPFQTNKIFSVKIKYAWGVLLHCSIVWLTCMVVMYPYMHHFRMQILILLLTITHIFQDKAKIRYNLKIENNNVWTFVFDEIIHVFIILLVSIDAYDLVPKIGFMPDWLESLYWNNKFIIAAIWYVILTYGANILIGYIKFTFFDRYRLDFTKSFLKYIGILERFVIASAILIGGIFYLIIPIALIPSILLNHRNKITSLDIKISAAVAVAIGVILKISLQSFFKL